MSAAWATNLARTSWWSDKTSLASRIVAIGLSRSWPDMNWIDAAWVVATMAGQLTVGERLSGSYLPSDTRGGSGCATVINPSVAFVVLLAAPRPALTRVANRSIFPEPAFQWVRRRHASSYGGDFPRCQQCWGIFPKLIFGGANRLRIARHDKQNAGGPQNFHIFHVGRVQGPKCKSLLLAAPGEHF